MRRPLVGLVVVLFIAGVAAGFAFYSNITIWLVVGWGVGLLLGAVLTLVIWRGRAGRTVGPAPDRAPAAHLLASLVEMGDVLQEVSAANLQRRGGWDQGLFDDVLAQVERQAPHFQQALIAYLAQGRALAPNEVKVLLAVDRLSAAYTYWTRLFPPRQSDESMFVLSLLQDLSERVECAIQVLDR